MVQVLLCVSSKILDTDRTLSTCSQPWMWTTVHERCWKNHLAYLSLLWIVLWQTSHITWAFVNHSTASTASNILSLLAMSACYGPRLCIDICMLYTTLSLYGFVVYTSSSTIAFIRDDEIQSFARSSPISHSFFLVGLSKYVDRCCIRSVHRWYN